MHAVEVLQSHLRNRPAQLRRLKDNGVKIIGYFVGDYVPEELIYASGAVPLCLCHGGNPMPADAALSSMTRFLCPFARALYGERLLKEQPYYELIDMLVVPITCQHLRRAGDAWDYYTGTKVFRFGIPHEYDSDSGLSYYIGMSRLLKDSLEEFTGNEITDEKIKEAIDLYNKMRERLKEISLVRKESQPPITTLDFIKLNHASFYADPSFIVDILGSLCQQLRGEGKEATTSDAPRLLLVGPNLAYGDYKILELAEEAGGMIVAEEICEGVRFYWENVESNGDLIQVLAKKYLRDRLPCAFMRESAKKRLDFIVKLAREFNVAGVIWYQLQYCDTYDIESYFFAQQMEKIGLRMLKLESDYNILDRGPLATRIETFIESLRGR